MKIPLEVISFVYLSYFLTKRAHMLNNGFFSPVDLEGI